MIRLLVAEERQDAMRAIRLHHYSRSVPSGKSYYYAYESALVVVSIPANQFIGRFLFGRKVGVWELSRLWAPDGHASNLLTQAISATVKEFHRQEPSVVALISYADPNVGHLGGVYKAASWIPFGQVEESRYYVDAKGVVVSRRKFHSGSKSETKAQILARGYKELKKPGRLRYVKPLTATARREFARWRGQGEK